MKLAKMVTDTGTMIVGQEIFPRSVGRPKGANYDHLDEPLYYEIDELIRSGKVASEADAFRRVAARAFGAANALEDSIIKRFRRAYPRHRQRLNQRHTDG